MSKRTQGNLIVNTMAAAMVFMFTLAAPIVGMYVLVSSLIIVAVVWTAK